LRGRDLADEVVVVGGHFDSWDVGTGASDDAVGCVVAWEAARLIKALDLRPRRTIRVVLFTNEENGLRGGAAYRDRYRDSLSKHVLMIESDSGVFPPLGVGISGPESARARLRDIGPLLDSVGPVHVDPAGGGADIGPSVQAGGIPAASINGESTRYFTIHHSPADTVDRIDARDVSRAVATMAVLAYLAAEIPERFGEPR
jgi:carboxypeptidase Q